MRTRGDIKTKLQALVMGIGTSTYFTPTRLETAIDDNYLLVASARQWGDIKKGFVTSTQANEEYYDYPDNCQTESVFRISVDGDSDYVKTDFEDYLNEKENNPTSTKKMFSEFGRQIFIYPTPTTTGTANLILWGTIQAAPLTSDGDTTMFTDFADVLNEAILQYAYSELIQNFDQNKSMNAIAKADKIINQEYKKIADRLQRKLLNRTQFEVPDFFSSDSGNIGDFTINK